jgi:hypothetical protein
VTEWVDARQALPPVNRRVLVRVRGRDLPLAGWFCGLVPGPVTDGQPTRVAFWRVPGYGTMPTHWCDCLPALPGEASGGEIPSPRPPGGGPPPREKVAGTLVRIGP